MIIRKTYKQGDSVAITLPKKLGVKIGTHYYVIKGKRNNITLKPVVQ